MRFLILVVVLGGFVIGCAENSAMEGFQSESFLKAKEKLKSLDSKAGQFCLNGAAFVLAGQHNYAEQYMEDFKECINALVKRVEVIDRNN